MMTEFFCSMCENKGPLTIIDGDAVCANCLGEYKRRVDLLEQRWDDIDRAHLDRTHVYRTHKSLEGGNAYDPRPKSAA